MGVVIRAAVVYLLLLLVLRITTRRIIRSATPLDMVIVFLFGGLSIQAILGEDRPMTNSLLAIGTIAVLHVAIARAKLKWGWIGLIVEGAPKVVFRDGDWDHEVLRQLRMEPRDVLTEARQNGLRSMDQVECAIAEHNGGISIIKKVGDS